MCNLYGAGGVSSGHWNINQRSKGEGIFSHSKEFQLSMWKQPPVGHAKEGYIYIHKHMHGWARLVPNSECIRHGSVVWEITFMRK